MTRPLLIIFLTIFVNLIGFGIIIPLLPFYAEQFGASPIVIGLLFAIFSLCQLVASPALGDLSDRWGRRPVLVFSLIGTVVSFVMLALAQSIVMLFLARIVDGLSGGNISTARAYVADVTEPKDRARAYGLIGAAFGLGFIMGPALSGVLAKVSITAPIWTAAAPSANAAAMPRPSPMPPDAITGTLTASAICGTSANVPICMARSFVRNMPRWPPASTPCAITASQPRSSRKRASATVVADAMIWQPAALMRLTSAASGKP